MSGHFQFGGETAAEALDLYLLGALEGEERAEVAAHLRQRCETCLGELPGAYARQAALGLEAGPAEAGAAVKRRVMAGIRPAARAGAAQHVAARAAWGQWAWGGLAAALAVLCLVASGRMLGLESRSQRLQAELGQAQRQALAASGAAARAEQQLRFVGSLIAAPDTQMIGAQATPQAPRARAYLNPRRGAVLIADHLPPAAAAHVYEMWLLPRTGNPVPAGMFQTSAAGTAVHAYAAPFEGIGGVAVSLEPAGGSAQPTGPIVLAAKLAEPQ